MSRTNCLRCAARDAALAELRRDRAQRIAPRAARAKWQGRDPRDRSAASKDVAAPDLALALHLASELTREAAAAPLDRRDVRGALQMLARIERDVRAMRARINADD